MISPLEIRQQTFGKAMRGYNLDEVRAYLQSLSQEWEKVLDDNKRLKGDLDKATERLKSYTEMEDIMRKTLHQAEQTARSTQEAAQREAELKLAEAQQRAKAIIADAEMERNQVVNSTQDLLDKKHQLVGQLKAFLRTELSEIEHYEENLVRKMQVTPRKAATESVPVQKTSTSSEAKEPLVADAPLPKRAEPKAEVEEHRQPTLPLEDAPATVPPTVVPAVQEKSAPPAHKVDSPAVSLPPANRSFFDDATRNTGATSIVLDLSQDL